MSFWIEGLKVWGIKVQWVVTWASERLASMLRSPSSVIKIEDAGLRADDSSGFGLNDKG